MAQDSTILAGIIAALATISGTIIGAIGTFFSAKAIATHADKLNACASLRAAFAPALAFLDLARKHGSTHEVPDVDSFLKNSLLEQAAAIERFRIFVPSNEKKAYQEAWNKYHQLVKQGFTGVSFGLSYEGNNNPWGEFENKIHLILMFSKP